MSVDSAIRSHRVTLHPILAHALSASSTARETRIRPSGYVAFIRDPDGHTLEVSCGQEVDLTIQHATEPHCGGRGMPRR